ncbi:DUF1508 domain-containing protein [Variovorax sp. RHLX14]|uniref:DUF1508 domain-containing protein n=1 Tax=Variovorax sp. RHLX14 TaxID=1259731 RepID=UPI003F480740
MKILISIDATGFWYWELQGANGRAMAITSVGYNSKFEVLEAIRDLRIVFSHAPVMDRAGNYLQDD